MDICFLPLSVQKYRETPNHHLYSNVFFNHTFLYHEVGNCTVPLTASNDQPCHMTSQHFLSAAEPKTQNMLNYSTSSPKDDHRSLSQILQELQRSKQPSPTPTFTLNLLCEGAKHHLKDKFGMQNF